MRFDFTSGKKERYLVQVYYWKVEDKFYYHYYKDAKKKFNELTDEEFNEGTIISIYDIEKDKRKAFFKFQ